MCPARPLESRPTPREELYVAVIGDVVKSRRIIGLVRRDLQKKIEVTLAGFNRRFATALAARFVVTVGDEFQGLLKTGVIIPDLIRSLELALPDIEVRLGIGRGRLDTVLRKEAIGMDGPAWHLARSAIEEAKRERRLGGVFKGFGQDDLVLDGLARILHFVRRRATRKQRAILEGLLAHETQTRLAEREAVTPQSISKQTKAAGVPAYREAEEAYRAVLERYGAKDDR